MNFLNIIGTILNFIGTVIVAFSVIKNPGGGYQVINGREVPLASILLDRFRIGICFIVIGFLLQLFEQLQLRKFFIPES